LTRRPAPGLLRLGFRAGKGFHDQFDYITAMSIEREDLELSPFNQLGGLGKAHQLFGEQLPKLLDELNTVLAA
jgi:type I restriction enzyme R subunit